MYAHIGISRFPLSHFIPAKQEQWGTIKRKFWKQNHEGCIEFNTIGAILSIINERELCIGKTPSEIFVGL